MKVLGKILLWLLMVALFVALVVGGTLWYFYAHADPGDAAARPLTVQLSAGGGQDTALAPSVWRLRVPVLGGVLWRTQSGGAGGEGQRFAWNSAQMPSLTLPDGVSEATVEVSSAAGKVFSGTAAEFAAWSCAGNGNYYVSAEAVLPAAADGERPAAYGTLDYKFTLAVSVTMTASASDDRVQQGAVVAVRLTNDLDGIRPTGESKLGPVNFIPAETANSWVAYVPVAYNRETGDYTIDVACGNFTASLPVAVEYVPYEKKNYTDASQLPDAADDESGAAVKAYRSAIWPLYDTSRPQKLWQGYFAAPVDGLVKFQFGVGSLLPGDTVSRRHTGIDYTPASGSAPVTAPAAGEVVFAGELALTGNTVVLEHGGGVKSYLYHLTTLAVKGGQTVEKGQQLGTLEAPAALHYEIKIGSQSVDPGPVLAGRGGLYQ